MRFLTFLLTLSTSHAVGGETAPITKMATDAGLTRCLQTITEMETFFGDGASYGNWATWAKENPSSQIFNTSIELTYKDGIHLVDLTVAPTADNYCSYAYTRTWVSSKSCLAVSKESFLKEFEYVRELNKDVALFSKGGVQVFLLAADPGCVIQKKEIGFRLSKQAVQP